MKNGADLSLDELAVIGRAAVLSARERDDISLAALVAASKSRELAGYKKSGTKTKFGFELPGALLGKHQSPKMGEAKIKRATTVKSHSTHNLGRRSG